MTVDILRELAAAEAPCALCLITRTEGATPQKRGAKMLVWKTGGIVGTVGGGAFEEAVRQSAVQAVEDRRHRVLVFHLDRDFPAENAMLCGGEAQVLIAPEAEHFREVWQEGVARHSRAESFWLVAREIGDGLVWEIADGAVTKAVYCEEVAAKPHLVIIGAGHIGRKVAQLAAKCGFHIVISDDRPENLAGIPPFGYEVRCEAPGEAVKQARKDGYILVATRGAGLDLEALAGAVATGARYIGMVGSQKKAEALFASLREKEVSLEQLQRVHCPVGLDIGAETPDEIAVSIVAQLVLERHRE